MTDLIFSTMAGTPGTVRQALLWARSIRSFAGRLAGAPLWLLVPNHVERLPAAERIALQKEGVRLISFAATEAELDFPFAGKTLAAGTAESLAHDLDAFLVWMDRDSLVIQEPAALILPDDKVLGYRPVDHTLIGSLIAAPPDPFWSLIYNYHGIDWPQVEPMVTTVDRETIRPYFNAGMLIVRPQRELLRTWSENFKSHYLKPAFTPFYDQDILYRIFIHQVILAGTLLAETAQQERLELPHLVNYPLHMHGDYPPRLRAARLNDVITCRYDLVADRPHWDQFIPIDEPLNSWLGEQRRNLDLL